MSKQTNELAKLEAKCDKALARLVAAYNKNDKTIFAAMDAFVLAHLAATFAFAGDE